MQQNSDAAVVIFSWTQIPDYALKGYDIGYAPQGTTDWTQFTMLTEAARKRPTRPYRQEHGYSASAPGMLPTNCRLTLPRKTWWSANPNLSIIHDTEENGWTGLLVVSPPHYKGMLIPDSQYLNSHYSGGSYNGWEWFDQWVVDPVSLIQYTTPTLDSSYNEQLRVWYTNGLVNGIGQTGVPSANNLIDTWLTGANDPAVYIPWTIGVVNMRYINGRFSANIAQGGLFMITDYTLNVDMSPVIETPATPVVISSTPNTTVSNFPAPFHYLPFITPVASSGRDQRDGCQCDHDWVYIPPVERLGGNHRVANISSSRRVKGE